MTVTDLKDTRVLIPKTRRALLGPQGSGFIDTDLSDDETNAIIADAIGNVILHGGSLFGHELQVVARDAAYLAPVAWQTDSELTEAEQALIVTQAALDYFYTNVASVAKTSERIQNEGQEWEWSISAQAVSERLKQLRADRDAALAALGKGAVSEDWVSFIQARDSYVSALIEPWVDGNNIGGLQLDARGFM